MRLNVPQSLRIEQGTRTGQPVIISLDSTRLGPAVGGCRIKPYASWQDGLHDALRLSAAMTAKAALAGLPYGGGKSVVALSPGTAADCAVARRSDLLADVGDIIESLSGRYITGPDVGTSPDDMAVIGQRTSHVRSLIADDLAKQGASLLVADPDQGRRELSSRLGARTASPEELLTSKADILVPAALGGILTPRGNRGCCGPRDHPPDRARGRETSQRHRRQARRHPRRIRPQRPPAPDRGHAAGPRATGTMTFHR